MISRMLVPAVMLMFAVAAQAQIISIDHSKVIGNDEKGGNCINCHQKETEAWSKTHHFRTLDKLKEGRPIAEKLGLSRSYRQTGFCVECHSTAKGADPKDLTTISGVSCESCHGAAADWVKIHNDYGAGKKKEDESADNKKMRHEKADAAGMIRKDRVYLIAKNCLSCHLVPNEQLVNVGGHKASSDFELVSWSHGEVKHNYFAGPENKDTTQERKRVMYVVGRVVDLEMSLYAAGKITEKGNYRAAILNRIRTRVDDLDAVVKAVDIAELSALMKGLERRDDGSLKLSQELLEQLPGKVAEVAKKFVENHDGSKLAAVDPLIPKADAYKGKPQP